MASRRPFVAGLGIALLAPLVAPSATGAAPAANPVVDRASAYLRSQQQADAGFEVAQFPGFETPDAVFALAAAAQTGPGLGHRRRPRRYVQAPGEGRQDAARRARRPDRRGARRHLERRRGPCRQGGGPRGPAARPLQHRLRPVERLRRRRRPARPGRPASRGRRHLRLRGPVQRPALRRPRPRRPRRSRARRARRPDRGRPERRRLMGLHRRVQGHERRRRHHRPGAARPRGRPAARWATPPSRRA